MLQGQRRRGGQHGETSIPRTRPPTQLNAPMPQPQLAQVEPTAATPNSHTNVSTHTPPSCRNHHCVSCLVGPCCLCLRQALWLALSGRTYGNVPTPVGRRDARVDIVPAILWLPGNPADPCSVACAYAPPPSDNRTQLTGPPPVRSEVATHGCFDSPRLFLASIPPSARRICGNLVTWPLCHWILARRHITGLPQNRIQSTGSA